MSEQPIRHRVLVLANEPFGTAGLQDTIRDHAHGAPAEIHVVAPALNSRLRHWVSDEDAARQAAGGRLDGCVSELRAAGLEADGEVGDANPLQAIADALVIFEPDELIVVSPPEERANWLARDVARRARDRFALPTEQVVIGGAERAEHLPLAA